MEEEALHGRAGELHASAAAVAAGLAFVAATIRKKNIKTGSHTIPRSKILPSRLKQTNIYK